MCNPFHLFPVNLYAWCQDQKVISDFSIVVRCYQVHDRVNGGNRIFNPFYAVGNAIFLLLPYFVRFINTGGDQCKAGLVELSVAGVYQCNVRAIQPVHQTCSHTNSGSPSTDYQDFPFCIARECMSFLCTHSSYNSCCC